MPLQHGRPLPNAALLGAFCAMAGVLGLESLVSAIMHKFPGAVGERNVLAARGAFELIHGTIPGGAAREGAKIHAQAS